MLFLDAFEPGESELTYTIRNATTGQIAVDSKGNALEGLTGNLIELWDLSASIYPFINLEVKFSSGYNQISTPTFYGYNFGNELGLHF